MVSKITQAVGIEAYGGVENLKLLKCPLPELRPHDLLVRIQAFAMNPLDSLKRNVPIFAIKPPSPENPMILGWDAAGVVEETGSEVTLYKKGDEVFFSGDPTRPGCNAQLMVVDERVVGCKPKTLSWAEAAAIPLTGLTAWEALEENMSISLNKEQNKDKTILFIAGAGGVGSIGIQLAKVVFGLKVVATASRQESVDFCKKMGADYVINHQKNLGDELKNIGLQGVDYILCGTPLKEALYDQLTNIINPLGVIVGVSLPAPVEKIDLSKIFPRRAKVSMQMMPSRILFNYNVQKHKEILDSMSKLLDEKKLFTTLTKVQDFSLEKLREEHISLEKSTNIGKSVMVKVQEFFEKN